jgi:hypothetical protein
VDDGGERLMALTLSTESGVVEVDHVEGEVVITVAGSTATLSAEHAGMLADFLLAVPEEDLEDVEVEEVEEAPEA